MSTLCRPAFTPLAAPSVIHHLICSDVECLVHAGLRPHDVACLLLDVFAQQTFAEGFTHGDPHPGGLEGRNKRHLINEQNGGVRLSPGLPGSGLSPGLPGSACMLPRLFMVRRATLPAAMVERSWLEAGWQGMLL
jgi:hypothetical protein